jgi:hypothetical protein
MLPTQRLILEFRGNADGDHQDVSFLETAYALRNVDVDL